MTHFAPTALGFAVAVGMLASATAAASAPRGPMPSTPAGGAVILVHDDRGDWRDGPDHPPYPRPRHHVDAPFAHVDTWDGGRVAVDAPFTSVRVGRRGTWVRAPFVNIFVPR